MAAPLAARLFTLAPDPRNISGDDVLDAFLSYVKECNLELYPAQEEALLEIIANKHVILNTPTGSGKSLVASALIFHARALDQRAFYTCPIKALVSEKFFNLCREFGPENVGMMTGDASVNRDAPIICCTAEILANIALREGERADVGAVVMDEFHYYADRERGVAWQSPLLTLPQARFLLMSATLGDTKFFKDDLETRTGREVALIRGAVRPVPLTYSYKDTPLHETITGLITNGRAPIYIVSFTQRGAAEEAQNLMSVDFCTKEEKRRIAEEIAGIRFLTPFGRDFQRFIRHGVGLHHAGLLPKYRLIVEKLAQLSLLKIISGTDTLGVGVNVPIRSVLFTKLCKYDGEKTGLLSVRDFQQIAGRAGRKGFDNEGDVVAQAPEHVIENLRLEAKAGSDPVKKKRIVRKKPPEKGYVPWDKVVFERLIASQPEPLISRFDVSHGMLLNVLQREGGGCMAMIRIVDQCHERPAKKRIIGKHAFALYQSLLDANIIERDEYGISLHVDLQEDFSLHHAHSLYLLDTLEKLDRESGTYALDLLSLVESILENPDFVLMRQVDKLKTEKMAQLKAAGVEYDERIAELEKVEYVKPHAEFIYGTFNEFARLHPWVSRESIRPKSIARDMFEQYLSFTEYVREYSLERGEGLLLRYLSEVYRALVQTVPTHIKTDEVFELELYFGAMIRAVDSSLIDEWERLKQGDVRPTRIELTEELDKNDVTKDGRAFTVLVRNATFALVRYLSFRNHEGVLTGLEPSTEWTVRSLDETMAPFWVEHNQLLTTPKARSTEHFTIEKSEHAWRVKQVMLDDHENHDWYLDANIDLETARKAGQPIIKLLYIGHGS